MLSIGADRIASAIMGEASAQTPSNNEKRMRKCAFDAGELFRIVPPTALAASCVATYAGESIKYAKRQSYDSNGVNNCRKSQATQIHGGAWPSKGMPLDGGR